MKNKLENLISFDDFKSSWKTEPAIKTKRTETGLDIIKEGVEEIIPEGLPNTFEQPDSIEEYEDDKYYNLSYEEKVEKITEFLDSELENENIDDIVNELRDVLLEMEQQGSVDQDTTDELDDKYDGDWKSWIKEVIELPDFPEEGLQNVLHIISNIENSYEEFDEESFEKETSEEDDDFEDDDFEDEDFEDEDTDDSFEDEGDEDLQDDDFEDDDFSKNFNK